MGVVKVYVDGSCLGNPGVGGFGVVVMYGGREESFGGGYRMTTNNRMELIAVIEGLRYVLDRGLGREVEVYSDSRYVVDSVERGWLVGWVRKGFRGVRNVDLWKEVWGLLKGFDVVRFVWVRGHSGDRVNEECDRIARYWSSGGGELREDVGYVGGGSGEGVLSLF